ncbi:MAG TPA: agmatine deiminase family protein [Polyangiales bacterium]|nr:agmatine deiminase family protein [Polyangiales bacterium]
MVSYLQPAEWSAHEACYTAWPAHEYAWGAQLRAAQAEFVQFVRAFAGDGQEPLYVLVQPEFEAEATAALRPDGTRVVLQRLDYGDVWLRDTGPVFVRGPKGRASLRFRFNGWGGKYVYPHDAELAGKIAALRDEPAFAFDWVLEGGAIDVDGEGTVLTTRQCLLNPNRTTASEAEVEARLCQALGVQRVIWLDQGLLNDHTDGHIDNIARFVAPGVVACMRAEAADDPNAETLEAIARALSRERDARGRKLEVRRIPSPSRVLDPDGQVMPASHMNFYIGNARVVLPVFGTAWDEPARAALQAIFPARRVVAAPARALLTGGGTFHCMTQQLPTP